MEQRHLFRTESFRYFLSSSEIPTVACPEFPETQGLNSILDVGCGAGGILNSWSEALGCEIALGYEPSDETVAALRSRWANTSLKFQVASLPMLPAESDSFDVVLCWSVLHWLGRNEFLQALGELVRVTKRYLVVMDFFPLEPHRTPYHHYAGAYTFKVDYEAPLLASGLLQVLQSSIWFEDEVFRDETEKPQYRGADTSPENRLRRKMVIFEKKPDLLPIRDWRA